jgi:hypothetical protein
MVETQAQREIQDIALKGVSSELSSIKQELSRFVTIYVHLVAIFKYFF